MSETICVVAGCGQVAAAGYFACEQHLMWKDKEPPHDDDWNCCVTCGQPTGSADVWQDACTRCAELAELEREIGYSMCVELMSLHARNRSSDYTSERILANAYFAAEDHTRNALARWRQLHAEDAQ